MTLKQFIHLRKLHAEETWGKMGFILMVQFLVT